MRARDEQKELLVKQKAIELLVKLGFQGFSMQKLAKAAKISPATLYIYYSDKDDLINKIGVELGKKMSEITLAGFDPGMSFAEGLKKQWENRAKYWMEHQTEASCYDVICHSPHGLTVTQAVTNDFRPIMHEFVKRAVRNKELREMPFEVYWSIAYGPLYNLIRFHVEGRSKVNQTFTLSKKMMYETLELVLKALKP